MRRSALLFALLLPACDRGVDSTPANPHESSDELAASSDNPHGENPHQGGTGAMGGAGGADPHAGLDMQAPNDAIHGGAGGGGGAMPPDTQAEMPPAPPFDAAHPNVGGVTWAAPSGFAYRAPTVPMRLAEYVVGRAGSDEVVMTVFHFPGMGGSIDSNVERWLGQFTQPDGRPNLAAAHIGSETVHGLRVTTVDIGGTYAAGSMGGGSGENQRLLGAIVESAAGPVFFKLVGPRATVDAAEANFRALVASFAPAGR